MTKDDKLDCCEKGKEFIFPYWGFLPRTSITNVDTGFIGWGIMVDFSYGDEVYEQIFYCPFCGKELEVIND